MNYNNYDNSYASSTSLDRQTSAVMKLVYVKMTLALIVTGLVAMFCSSSIAFVSFMATHSWAMWVTIIAEFALVIAINSGINKMSTGTATLLFYLFAIVNAVMLSQIFMVYTHESIAKTFFITAGTFAAMSVYGYTTSKDLTKFGSFLFMALIGLIIASLVNIFLHSSTMQWIISFCGVLIFIGLTAWDTQTVKRMAAVTPANQLGKLATIGALSLYLDFINLFLYLLRFFGNSND